MPAFLSILCVLLSATKRLGDFFPKITQWPTMLEFLLGRISRATLPACIGKAECCFSSLLEIAALGQIVHMW